MAEEFLESLPTDAIRQATAEFSGDCLAELLAKPDCQDLCAFALSTISDATSFYWSANTGSHLDQVVAQAMEGLKDSDSSVTEEQIRSAYEFEPTEWPITDQYGDSPVTASCNAANDAVHAFWEAFKQGPVNDDNFIDLAMEACPLVLNALGDGLADAVQATDWTAAGGRENVTVLLWVNDPGESDIEVVRAIAQRINSAEAFERFSQGFFADQ